MQKCVVEENGGVATESQYKQYQAAAKQAAKPRLFDIAYAINYLKEAGKTVIVGAYEADFQLVQSFSNFPIIFWQSMGNRRICTFGVGNLFTKLS